ncbi:DUF6177 family protein [Streptomyces sp. NBC_00859]|uniref:DUF6177 family protein n=1 Tax=Streptomyces sp. NBC_00859 TaxID=2903682 RepID=UPI003864C431
MQDPECGYYDGLSGAVLRWQDGTFAPAHTTSGTGDSPVAGAFAETTGGGERQLVVAFRVLREPEPTPAARH